MCLLLQSKQFGLQIDESTLRDNESLLLGYVRYVHNDSYCEELLFALPLVSDTKGETVFNTVRDFFAKKGIPMQNIVACATDGAPSMVGCHRGFLAYLSKQFHL